MLSRVVVGRFQRGLHRVGGCLGIDENASLARKVHRHVGPHARFFQCDGLLFGEVAVRQHPRLLDDVAQLHFAPFSARSRIAQRGYQRRRLRRQAGRCGFEFFGASQQLIDLGAQAAGVVLALGFEFLNQPVEFVELLRDRSDQFADAFAGAAGGRFAQLVLGALQRAPRSSFPAPVSIRCSVARRPLVSAREISQTIAAPMAAPAKNVSAVASVAVMASPPGVFFNERERSLPRACGGVGNVRSPLIVEERMTGIVVNADVVRDAQCGGKRANAVGRDARVARAVTPAHGDAYGIGTHAVERTVKWKHGGEKPIRVDGCEQRDAPAHAESEDAGLRRRKLCREPRRSRANVGIVLLAHEFLCERAKRRRVAAAVAVGGIESRVEVRRDRRDAGFREASDDVANRRIDAPDVHDDHHRGRVRAGRLRPRGVRRNRDAPNVQLDVTGRNLRIVFGDGRRMGVTPRRGLCESGGDSDTGGRGSGEPDERAPVERRRRCSSGIDVETVHEGAV